MEILSIVTKVPNHSMVYVFGSVLSSSKPNDIDLLIIYDETKCAPHEAFDKHANFIREIERKFDMPVHLMLLTIAEAKSVSIFERINAIPLDKALEKLT